jgi:hypothetical protein
VNLDFLSPGESLVNLLPSALLPSCYQATASCSPYPFYTIPTLPFTPTLHTHPSTMVPDKRLISEKTLYDLGFRDYQRRNHAEVKNVFSTAVWRHLKRGKAASVKTSFRPPNLDQRSWFGHKMTVESISG